MPFSLTAQTSQRNVGKDLNDIYKTYQKTVSKYSYKKNAEKYYVNKQEALENKLNALRILYKQIYDEDTLVAKKYLWIYLDDDKSVPTFYKENDFLKLSKEETDILLINYKPKFQQIRNKVLRNFPSEYFEGSKSDVFRCSLHFGLDADGRLKFIKSKGDDEEFNLVNSILLYSFNINIDPYQYQGENIYMFIQLPIQLQFE